MRVGLMVLALALVGCEEKQEAPLAPIERAQQAAEHRLRSHRARPAAVTYRGVRSYRHSAPDTFTICGEVNFTGRDPDRYVPFISIVRLPAGGPPEIDQGVLGENRDATRMQAEMVTLCVTREAAAGSAPTAPVPVPATPVPADPVPAEPAPLPVEPSPDPVPEAMIEPEPPPPLAQAPGKLGDVHFTNRVPAYLHRVPDGPVIDMIPPGVKLRVFSVAPGNWVRVGGEEPWGWVHGTLPATRIAPPPGR
jgi:hypothetical protein